MIGRAPTSSVTCSRSKCRLASMARRQLVVVYHGHPHGHPTGATATAVKSEKEKGFVAEMRKVSMRLHTKEQAPKEGGIETPKATKAWTPTRPGYLRFLAESQVVYDALESIVKDPEHTEYAAFSNTGLERAQALATDIAWYKATFNMDAPALTDDGPGKSYAAKMHQLAKSDPPAFICHFYNYYFAHTAGGRMIGKSLEAKLLDGHTLEFYKWDKDVNESLESVRKTINQLAETWTPEQREHCLQVTEESFKLSGQVMACIVAEE